MMAELKRYAKVTAGILLLTLAVFLLPALIGVWIPDVINAPRNVLAEKRSDSGETVRVIQYWNRCDFYNTELEYIGKDGKTETFVLDPDDAKSWRVPLSVDWESKMAKVTLGGCRLRTVDLTDGTVDW